MIAGFRLDQFKELLWYMFRRQWRAALWRRLARPEGATPPLTVGFVDLVRFTAVTEQVADDELEHIVVRFEEVAHDAIAENDGRVVKMIGDAVMYAAERPDLSGEGEPRPLFATNRLRRIPVLAAAENTPSGTASLEAAMIPYSVPFPRNEIPSSPVAPKPPSSEMEASPDTTRCAVPAAMSTRLRPLVKPGQVAPSGPPPTQSAGAPPDPASSVR